MKKPQPEPGPDKWLKVKATDFYGRWEEIKGIEVKPGMEVYVKWKDGSVTREKIVLQLGTDTAQVDMNDCPDRFRTREILIYRKERGVAYFIPLRYMRVQRAPKRRINRL